MSAEVKSLTNYYKDGKLNTEVIDNSVMVNSSSDLDALKNVLKPGYIAYTAGFKNMWQLNVSGSWVAIVTE